MDISFSYELTWEDYIDSQIAYNRNSEEVRKSIRKTRLGLVSFYVFALLILYPALSGWARMAVLGAIFILGALHICFVGKLYEMRVKNVSRKIIKESSREPKTEAVIGSKKIILDGGEITYKEELKTTRTRIENIVRILESDSNYLIFTDETSAIILPKEYEGEKEIQKKIMEYIKAPSREERPEAR